jgi:hypothetical protein
LAAREQGASVLVLEAAPEDESGGNSRFTAGSIRVVYNGVDDIRALVPDLTDEEVRTTDFGTYTQDQFFDDMARVTRDRADPGAAEAPPNERKSMSAAGITAAKDAARDRVRFRRAGAARLEGHHRRSQSRPRPDAPCLPC